MIDHEAVRLLGDIPAAQAKARGGQMALSSGGRSLTYAELEHRARVMAEVLRGLGVQRGDRVAWLGRNSEFYFELFFGLAAVGACLNPVNFRLSPQEIAFILEDSGARLLFITPDQAGLATDALAQLAEAPAVVSIGGAAAGYRSYDVLAATVSDPAPLAPARPEDDLLQLYTSGTTGRPKGVQLTNAAYGEFLKISPQVEGFNYPSGDALLIVMPLFHVAGFNVSLMGLAHGCRVIVLEQFNAGEVLRLIEAEKVAQIFLAPSMIQMMLQAPEIAGADLSSLSTIGYGSSPIGEATLREAQARFGCGFVQFYGMTESAAAGTFLAPSAHQPDKLLSCGKPWPGVEARIAGLDGRELAVGEVGEIQLRGGTLMKGYMNRPEATAETLIDGGWLRTGDAGYQDAEGFFYVHDRLKDMIVTGGENVYPAEVENAIFGCPGVADVAVIGVPSDRWGEEVRAVVVPAAGAEPDAQAVIAWVRARIAGYKTPKAVDFVEALPRNASGKVLRRELREPYWAGRGRAVG
ncbi:long-chain-fatty-acid--CoA ligase [Caulobacter mirabilis]|uniref:3-methylmercaptopropionyl-CoA ligase n=1 Tax=Caulobacter mirabilis TaxID=69666 RepID=A0A2D2B1R0_9CAUL|nr:long-chain-fatty-acid--CoA ligase [Caulobacter mirabilis]ATQ44148.1 acyl-CoA synthetase [Caulobacter mirabilis]